MKNKFLNALVIALMLFQAVAPTGVLAWTGTDQADYAPGSVVTISGDNSDGAGYIAGETVHVDVTGPNGYTAACDAIADDNGAWFCQVTLWADLTAMGDYSYTATGLSSGVSQTSAFTDATNVDTTTTLNPISPTVSAGQSVAFAGKVTAVQNIPTGSTVELEYTTNPNCNGNATTLASVVTTKSSTNVSFSSSFTAPAAGTYYLYARFTGADTGSGSTAVHWQTSNSACQTIVVNAVIQNQTITFTALANKTYGDADFGVNATASSGLQVSFTASGNCSVSGNTVHITGAGSCTITASQAGNSNYYPAPDVSRSFNIAKAGATVTLSNLTQTYTGSPLYPTATTNPPNINVVWTNAPQTNVGTYSVTATIDDPNYQGAASGNFVINPADAVCTVTGFNGAYDGNPHGASGSCTGVGGGTLSGLQIAATTYTNVPGGLVHWTFSNPNYKDQSGDATVTITKADAVCTVTGFNGTYDGNAHGASGSCTGVGGGTLSGLVIAPSTYTDVPGGSVSWTFSNNNYKDQSGDAQVTIAPADAVCTVTGFNGAYDGDPHGATGSCTGVGGGTLSGLVIAPSTYTDVPGGSVSWTFSNPNYKDQNGDATVTITKADAVCTVTGFNGTYDGNPHGASGSCTGVGGGTLSGLVIAPSTYTDVPGGSVSWTFSNPNYKDQNGAATVTITKADAICTVTGFNGAYDGNPHGATGSCTGVGGGTLSGLVIAPSTYTDVPGGSVSWTFSNPNYKDQNGAAAVTITKADAVCTVTGFNGAYDGNPHGATGSCTGVGGGTLSGLQIAATTYTNVPGGLVHWTFSNPNYKDQGGAATVTITKADAVIVVTGFSGVYDGDPHGVINSSATGVKNEALSGLVIAPSTYTDVPGGLVSWTFSNPNYKDQNGDAQVTITKADAAIVVTGFSGVYDGNPHGVVGSSAKGVKNEALSGLEIATTTYTNVPGGLVSWTFSNPNYKDQSGGAIVIITKADAAIVVTGFSGVYDGDSHGATGTAKGVKGEALSGLDLGATFTNVPGGTAKWVFTDVTGNYKDQSGDVTIVITKADATVVVTGYTGVYDGNPHGAAGAAKGVKGEILNGLDLGVSFTNVPGGTAKWVFTDVTGNYKDQSGDVAIVISKADATISVTPYNVTYDGASHTATGMATGVKNEILSGLDLTGTTHTNASSVLGYWDSWTFTDVTGNYNNGNGLVIDHIAKADAVINVTGYTGVYDGNPHGASGTAVGVESTPADLNSLLHLGANFTNAPGGTANWTFDGNDNYNSANGSVAIVINKADATVSVSGYTGVYDAAAHGATGTAKGVGGVDLSAGLNLGSTFTDYPGGTAHWTFAGGTNYKDQAGDVAIVISKADATCTVTGYSVIFDNVAHTATGSCTGVTGVNLNGLNLGSTTHTLVGKYADTWNFSGGTNYNDKSGTVADTISSWTLKGFYQPVDMGNVWNTVKNGSTVPLKFNIFAGSTEIKDVSAVKITGYKLVACTVLPGAIDDTIEVLATGGTVLRYDSTGGQFIFNWKTPSTAGKCYEVTMTTQDGSFLSAFFKLK